MDNIKSHPWLSALLLVIPSIFGYVASVLFFSGAYMGALGSAAFFALGIFLVIQFINNKSDNLSIEEILPAELLLRLRQGQVKDIFLGNLGGLQKLPKWNDCFEKASATILHYTNQIISDPLQRARGAALFATDAVQLAVFRFEDSSFEVIPIPEGSQKTIIEFVHDVSASTHTDIKQASVSVGNSITLLVILSILILPLLLPFLILMIL